MKKHIIIALFFTLFCGICHAQPFAGLKVGTDLGLEAGFKGKKFSVKAYTFTDYTSTRLFVAGKKDTDAHEGNRYMLAYGVGAGFKLAGPFWINVDAGYAWAGKYTIDPVYDTRARKNSIDGFQLGLEAQWYFSDILYLDVGYFTIPKGFFVGRPVHCVMATIGVRL